MPDSRTNNTSQSKKFREKWMTNQWQVSVYKLLDEFRGLRSSNPRDRIYAFLGLNTSFSNDSFTPNYKLSLRQTYIRFAKALISHTNSIDILNCAKEWRNAEPKKEQAIAYSVVEQSKYHDTRAQVCTKPGDKPRMGWVRLPDGWEQIQVGKGLEYVDRLAQTRQPVSPPAGLPPPPAPSVHASESVSEGVGRRSGTISDEPR